MVLPEGALPGYDTPLLRIDLPLSLPHRIGMLLPRPSRQVEHHRNRNGNLPHPEESSSRPIEVD